MFLVAPKYGADSDRDRALVRLSSDLGAAELVSQARRLADDRGVHPAAFVLLAGAALELSLRGLAIDQEVEIAGRPSINAYAAALRSARLLSPLEKKQIDVWAEVRNLAAHGLIDEIRSEDAISMLDGVNAFLVKREASGDEPSDERDPG